MGMGPGSRHELVERSFQWLRSLFWPPATVSVAAGASWNTVNTIAIPENSTCLLEGRMSVVRTDAGNEAAEGAGYQLSAVFRNDAGTVHQVGTPKQAIGNEDETALNVRFQISGTDVLWQVYGVVGKTYNSTGWVLKTLVEV